MGKRKKTTTTTKGNDDNNAKVEKPLPVAKKKKKQSPAKKKAKTILPKTEMKRVVLNEKKNEYLRVMSTNVAGLRGLIKNEERIKKFLTVVEKERPNIIALQEHKLQEQHVEDVGKSMKEILPDYAQYWTCSGPPAKKGYSGVAMFVRSSSNNNDGSSKKSTKKQVDGFG